MDGGTGKGDDGVPRRQTDAKDDANDVRLIVMEILDCYCYCYCYCYDIIKLIYIIENRDVCHNYAWFKRKSFFYRIRNVGIFRNVGFLKNGIFKKGRFSKKRGQFLFIFLSLVYSRGLRYKIKQTAI